jgi:hypothetical protein
MRWVDALIQVAISVELQPTLQVLLDIPAATADAATAP